MKIFQDIMSWFSRNSTPAASELENEDENEDDPAEEAPPEQKELPDIIEVPWELILAMFNLNELKNKTFDQIKENLYASKIRDMELQKTIKAVDDRLDIRDEELRTLFGTTHQEFDLYLPQSAGNPGRFEKKIKKKQNKL